jgi:hypothetical protein
MNQVYSMHELKTHLSRLVKEMDEDGIVFGERGKATFRISRIDNDRKRIIEQRRRAFGMIYSPEDLDIEPEFGGVFANLEDMVSDSYEKI